MTPIDVRFWSLFAGAVLAAGTFCFGLPPLALADIFECRVADGGRHYTNSASGYRACRRIVRSRRSSSRTERADAVASSARPSASDIRYPSPPSSLSAEETSYDRFVRYDSFIREASSLYRLPEPFVRAVVKVESNFNRGVVSSAGAIGLMQLMPHTARSMGVTDPFDPRQNILGGTRYLRVLANKFNGDLVLTVAAYNAGHNAVLKYRGVPPYEETRRYVRRVLTHYYAYRK